MRGALVIVNPIAGRGRGERCLGELKDRLMGLGFTVATAITGAPGDAREAAAAAEGHDLVVVAGGDGTLNEVLNGLDADRPLALLPLGTGNVLAKELRLPRRVDRFCQMVARGRERLLDVATANGRRFVSMVGAGFDAEVAARLAARRKGTIRMWHYTGLIASCLASYGEPRIVVTVDGHAAAEARGFALVSNVRSYGGPFTITPQAKPDDGQLEVCILPRGGLLRYIRAMLAFMLRWTGASGASYLHGRSIGLSSETPVRYQVDGDPAGFLPTTVQLSNRRVRFLVP